MSCALQGRRGAHDVARSVPPDLLRTINYFSGEMFGANVRLCKRCIGKYSARVKLKCSGDCGGTAVEFDKKVSKKWKVLTAEGAQQLGLNVTVEPGLMYLCRTCSPRAFGSLQRIAPPQAAEAAREEVSEVVEEENMQRLRPGGDGNVEIMRAAQDVAVQGVPGAGIEDVQGARAAPYADVQVPASGSRSTCKFNLLSRRTCI
jgi:hypothetical protein